MYYGLTIKEPMIKARITLKPEYATELGAAPGQLVVERLYTCPEDLIMEMKAFEYAIADCITVVNGRMLQLASFKIA